MSMRGPKRGEGGAGVRTPNKVFLNNTAPDPFKSQSYQASIQCWAIIGTPVKRIWIRLPLNINEHIHTNEILHLDQQYFRLNEGYDKFVHLHRLF